MEKIEYNKDEDSLIFTDETYHCVSVVQRELGGKMKDQAHCRFIGGQQVELDLSLDKEKAILRGPDGEVQLTIKGGSAKYCYSWKKGSKTIRFGENGKETLREGVGCLKEVESQDNVSFETDRVYSSIRGLKTICLRIANERGIVPPEVGFLKEMQKLKCRADFAYDKDYSHLYMSNILRPQKPKKR